MDRYISRARGRGGIWQTRCVQVALGATPWRFESSRPHNSIHSPGSLSGLGVSIGLERCDLCGGSPHDFTSLPRSYPYLLGLYLGDGCISEHPRGVARLRVHLDLRYPGIIEECRRSIQELLPRNRVHLMKRGSNYTGSSEPTSVVVSAYSKRWPCLIPQHGPGRKHERLIELSDWQEDLVGADPGLFLRGLIHSDGCRFINTGRNWKHPRYSFTNESSGIRDLFVRGCTLLGLRCTFSGRVVYVSRKADVAVLDRFIGPKR